MLLIPLLTFLDFTLNIAEPYWRWG